jgi:membrane protease YdiL (CAAX protease family)
VLALRGRRALAILLSALAFGCIHLSNPGASLLSVLGNSLGGVMYGVAFLCGGSLWLAIGLHFAWNFVQGPLLGFPVSGMAAGGLQQVHDVGPAWLSGGAYGPEAGLAGIAFRFVIVALVLLWLKSAWRNGTRHAKKGAAAPFGVQ